MPFPQTVEIAHFLISRHLKPGDRAIDATVGNGHDTHFLAEIVGSQGRVDGFEIQPQAIASAETRLASLSQVHLHLAGHETMGQRVEPGVAAVMFNLGYLPSGDKSAITRAETTLVALEAAQALIAEGGLVTVVVYPGHPGGREESIAVARWFETRDPSICRTLLNAPINPVERETAPYLLAMERRSQAAAK